QVVAALNINKSGWDLALTEDDITSSRSTSPFADAGTGVQQVSVNNGTGDAYNAVVAPGTYAGTAAEINALLNNGANWQIDAAFVNEDFSLPSAGVSTVHPPSITAHPEPQLLCPGEGACFSVTAAHACAYFWQVSEDGETFTDLTDDEIYSGTNTETLV